MKTIQQRIFFFVTATLFAASTVCCVLDDVWIDHSAPNYAHKHDCHATNCPVCGSQYHAQFETERLQKDIFLASDELCATLSLLYATSFREQEPTHNLFARDASPDQPIPLQPSPAPLRI